MSAARSSSRRPPEASAAGAERSGRRRPAAGTGHRSAPRSARPTAPGCAPRPARWPAGRRLASGRAGRPERSCPVVSAKPGRTAAARSTNRRTASCSARRRARHPASPRQRLRAPADPADPAAAGQRQRRHPPDRLAADAQRFPAGGDQPQLRAAGDQVADEIGDRVDDVLAGVQDQQQLPAAQRVDEGGRQPAGRALRRYRARPPPGGPRAPGRRCRRARRARRRPGTRSASCQPSLVASLVLPMPPGPHSVSARTLLSSSARSPRSRSRPTKLFGSAGRLPRRGTVSAVIATSVCLRVIRSSLSPGAGAS